jgi:hypothetical protein
MPSAPAEDWLMVLSPAQAYSVEMDLLWMAQPGDRYRVCLIEDGYALAIWDYDPNQWPVWIRMDDQLVRRVVAAAGRQAS